MNSAFYEVFPRLNDAVIASRLIRPSSDVRDVVLDTDTYNEIDDQYALSYLVRSGEACRICAITAAPFYGKPEWKRLPRSTDPGDGMRKSYDEICHMLHLLSREDLVGNVFYGADRYMPGPLSLVDSDGARAIVRCAEGHGPRNPLYVVALACLTNVASALLLDPTLRERIQVIWLGGHAHHFGTCNDFNCRQDIDAARLVMSCGVPLVQLPLFGVISHFSFCEPELRALFGGKNAVCDYLVENTISFMQQKNAPLHWSKPLWDICVAAWVVNPDFFLDRIATAPLPQWDETYSFPPDAPPLRYVYYVFKDALVADMLNKLT